MNDQEAKERASARVNLLESPCTSDVESAVLRGAVLIAEHIEALIDVLDDIDTRLFGIQESAQIMEPR